MQIRSVWELNFFFNYNNCNKSKNICVQNELDILLNIWGKKIYTRTQADSNYFAQKK